MKAVAERAIGPIFVALLLAGMTASSALARDEKPSRSSRQNRSATGSEVGQESVIAAIDRLPPEYRQWVLSVRGLITVAELEYFLSLEEDYRRDFFMEAFWQVRDPFPETHANELRERWQMASGGGTGIPFDDPRFVVYLLNGPPGGYLLPNGQPVSRCFAKAKELEIWFYGGSERVDRKFLVIFQKRGAKVPYEVYFPGDTLRPTQRTGGLPSRDISALCADNLLRFAIREVALTADYGRLMEQVLQPPTPSAEWLSNLRTSSTDLPEGAETFGLEVEIRFPARRQSRTALQVMLVVPLDQAPGRRFEGELFHNFQVIGEVIRDGSLFESLRYRFEGPTPEEASQVPLGFTRYLRPGATTLRILVEDVFTGRYAQVVREIEIPSPEGLPVDPGASRPADLVSTDAPGGGPSLRLLEPAGDVHAGLVRFSTRTEGTFDQVTFYLDGKPILSKRRPPYSVELDLGSVPAPHQVRVVGFLGGTEVASDQIWLNQAARRFAVRLLEPQPGGIYPGSLTARVDVQTPDGQAPERLELFLDEERIAVLSEPPYVRGLHLPGQGAAVVRAVAYLADGSSAEDAVIVNTSELLEVIEVQLIEVFPLVLDARGTPILDLGVEEFRIFEDGSPQEILRFGSAREAPIHAALLIDRSASMEPHLSGVAEAALAFARAAMRSPEDRLAVLSFADRLEVDVDFTTARGAVERALAGLVARGGTALHDSLVRALNLFEGIRGNRTLLVFSDGRDENSRLTLEQTLEASRRAGVTLYAVGLQQAFPEKAVRKQLEELTAETGGRAVFIAELAELAGVYADILEEVRSRYFLTYQSTSVRPESEFRAILVEVDRRGVKVRARQGYFP